VANCAKADLAYGKGVADALVKLAIGKTSNIPVSRRSAAEV
jgi:hypothetical protein